MRKLVAVVLTLAMVLTSALALAEPIKIAVVTPDADHGFTGESVAHARAELEAQKEALGDDFEYSFEVGGSPEIQTTAIENILANFEPDVFVLWPNEGQALKAAAQEILDSGTKLVVYDRLIDGLEGFDAEVMGDNEEIGRMMGNYILNYFADRLEAGETLQYLLFVGDSSTVSDQRTGGMIESFDASSSYAAQFEQIQSFQTDWSNAKALEQMEGWLNTASTDEVEGLDFIVTHDDEIIDGLYVALEGFAGNQNIKLMTSVGGRRETLATFENSELGIDLVTYFFSPSYIREAIRLAIADAQGETEYNGWTIDGGQYLIPTIEIDKTNIDEYRQTQEYIDRYSLSAE